TRCTAITAAVPVKRSARASACHIQSASPLLPIPHPAALRRHGLHRPCRSRCHVACVTSGSLVEGCWPPCLARSGVSQRQAATAVPVGHLPLLSTLRQPACAPSLTVRGVLPRWHVPPPCQGARSWLVPFHSPRAPYGFP